jgi:hypothetical protein
VNQYPQWPYREPYHLYSFYETPRIKLYVLKLISFYRRSFYKQPTVNGQWTFFNVAPTMVKEGRWLGRINLVVFKGGRSVLMKVACWSWEGSSLVRSLLERLMKDVDGQGSEGLF